MEVMFLDGTGDLELYKSEKRGTRITPSPPHPTGLMRVGVGWKNWLVGKSVWCTIASIECGLGLGLRSRPHRQRLYLLITVIRCVAFVPGRGIEGNFKIGRSDYYSRQSTSLSLRIYIGRVGERWKGSESARGERVRTQGVALLYGRVSITLRQALGLVCGGVGVWGCGGVCGVPYSLQLFWGIAFARGSLIHWWSVRLSARFWPPPPLPPTGPDPPPPTPHRPHTTPAPSVGWHLWLVTIEMLNG